MEKELKYLSERIVDLEEEKDFRERVIAGSDFTPMILHYKRKLGYTNTEIEIVKSIIDKLTKTQS